LWDRIFESKESDPESDTAFAQRILESCNAKGWHRWIDRAASAEEYAEYQVSLCETNGQKEFFRLDSETSRGGVSVEYLVKSFEIQANKVCLYATQRWHHDMCSMIENMDFGTLAQLLEALGKAAAPEAQGYSFYAYQSVEFWWHSDHAWYPGIVTRAYKDGSAMVTCTQNEWHGKVVHMTRHHIRSLHSQGLQVPAGFTLVSYHGAEDHRGGFLSGPASDAQSYSFYVNQSVEIWWHSDRAWYAAIVKQVHKDGSADVTCMQNGWHNKIFRVILQNIRPLHAAQSVRGCHYPIF